MKKKFAALLLALLLIVSCVACGNAAPAPASSMPKSPMATPASAYAPAESELNRSADYGGLSDISAAPPLTGGSDSGSVYTNLDAKLIRRASLVLETLEFESAMQELDKLVAHCEGYYGNSDVYSGYNSSIRTGIFTIRIPKERYELFLGSVGEVGQITRRNESTEDVGEHYYNTELRLATLETKHKRVLTLLERATDMETIIALEMTLADIEYQIDYMGSTLRRYDSLIDYSTIDLELYEKVMLTPESGERDSFASRFGRAFAQGLADFGYDLQWFAIDLAYNFIGLIVFLVIVIVALVVARRKIRKRKTARVIPVVGEAVTGEGKADEQK